jgi:hypothetical protein
VSPAAGFNGFGLRDAEPAPQTIVKVKVALSKNGGGPELPSEWMTVPEDPGSTCYLILNVITPVASLAKTKSRHP